MKLLRIALLTGLIGGASFLTLWLFNLRDDFGTEFIADTSGLADNSMRDIELITTTEMGKPRYRLRADYMLHFPANDNTELESPNLLYYRIDKPPVTIRSETARIAPRGEARNEEIAMHGKVHISHPADGNRSAFSMETTELRVYPSKNIARTDEYFTAHRSKLYFEGVGMEVHLLTDTFFILSEAKGIHAP